MREILKEHRTLNIYIYDEYIKQYYIHASTRQYNGTFCIFDKIL